MKFKSITWLTIIMIGLAAVPCLWGEEKSGGAQSDPLLPVAFVPDPNYEFGSVLDGAAVLHEFIIKNTGGAALVIEKVRTSCGCTTASYTKEIPAGGEGKIAIKGNTSGSGGRKFSKTITVSTNDPKNRNLILRISGQVEKFVRIEPGTVRLKGAAGEKIQTSVAIIPEEKYPFKIVETSAKEGKNIRFTVKKEEDRYVLAVENLMESKGRYFDEIRLKTDSSATPEISIRVYGNVN